jgi:hypothetical protein
VRVEPGDVPLVIRPDDAPSYSVVADMRDIRLWERVGPRNTLRRLAENPSADDYYSLAHITLKRQRMTVPTLAEFIESTVVAPDQSAATAAKLEREELIAVLDKAMRHEEATPESVADTVMDLMETLRDRVTDPTRPAH